MLWWLLLLTWYVLSLLLLLTHGCAAAALPAARPGQDGQTSLVNGVAEAAGAYGLGCCSPAARLLPPSGLQPSLRCQQQGSGRFHAARAVPAYGQQGQPFLLLRPWAACSESPLGAAVCRPQVHRP